jgi:hypothetical protein
MVADRCFRVLLAAVTAFLFQRALQGLASASGDPATDGGAHDRGD